MSTLSKEAIAREAAEKFITDFAPLHADGKTKVSKTQLQWAFEDAIDKAKALPPDSFTAACNDFIEGRIVDMETALTEKPPPP